jgi:hypothetical protein
MALNPTWDKELFEKDERPEASPPSRSGSTSGTRQPTRSRPAPRRCSGSQGSRSRP